jgi:hypothetical protein
LPTDRRLDAFGQGFRHPARPVPHSIVQDRNLIFLPVRRPFQVGVHNLEGILPPDNAMTRTDHLDREIQSQDFLDFLLHKHAEGGQDIGIIFNRFLIEFGLIDQIVEAVLGGQLLSEGIGC